MKYLLILVAVVCLLVVKEADALKCVGHPHIYSAVGSTSLEDMAGDQAIDGNFSSRWSAKGLGVYITIDLGSSVSVCSLSVAWWQSPVRTYNYVISVSSNNVTFTQITTGVSMMGPEQLQSYGFTQTTARYVRLAVNGNSANLWANVLEMQAGGPGFTHPGIYTDAAQIAFVKSKIAAGLNPWTHVMQYSWLHTPYGKSTYTPGVVSSVLTCPKDAAACARALDDGLAAWTLTLIWQYTGDISYATSAIRILNAYSSTLTKIVQVNSDKNQAAGVLYSAWYMELWPRAAELLKWGGNSGWAAADQAKFANMLSNVFLPMIYNGWWGTNNWELAMIEGTMNIAIFTDNQTAFDQATTAWVASCCLSYFFFELARDIYLTSDGPKPYRYGTTNNNWVNTTTFVNGLCQECCRDSYHFQMGFASLIYACETSRIQGGPDLYSIGQNRIIPTFELMAGYTSQKMPTPFPMCKTPAGAASLQPTWDVMYNHYHNRLGLAIPNVTAVYNILHAAGYTGPYEQNLQMGWEQLTHSGGGNL